MRKFWLSTVLTVAASLMAGASFAQTGGYCSLTASDGIWGFLFGGASPRYQCLRVENALDWYTYAPIQGRQAGYYDRFGLNRVTIRCAGYRDYVYGYGDAALQEAYEIASFSGASYCLFTVR